MLPLYRFDWFEMYIIDINNTFIYKSLRSVWICIRFYSNRNFSELINLSYIHRNAHRLLGQYSVHWILMMKTLFKSSTVDCWMYVNVNEITKKKRLNYRICFIYFNTLQSQIGMPRPKNSAVEFLALFFSFAFSYRFSIHYFVVLWLFQC